MASRGQHKLLPAGARAPEFRLEQMAGGAISLGEILAGGPALLVFFKVSCPICQLTFPFLERIYQAGGLRIFGISQNDAYDTNDFVREFGVTFPTLLDTEESGFPASNEYGISSVPTMFLVEPGGAVSQVIEGWRKRDMEALAAAGGGTLWRQGDYVPEWKAG
jgi:peroxiredoxin